MPDTRPKRTTRTRGLGYAGLLTAFLAGCTVGPDYARPDLTAITDAPYEHAGDATPAESQADALAWWERYDDPQLNALIARLASSNLDLRIAYERLTEARARRGLATAQGQPTVDLAGEYSRLGSGDDALSLSGAPPGQETDLFAAGVLVGWELDLWGRVRRLVEQSDAEIAAAGFGVHDAFASLSAELALTYFDLLALHQRLDIAERNTALQEQTLDLARSRQEAGTGTEADVALAVRTLEQTRARSPSSAARSRPRRAPSRSSWAHARARAWSSRGRCQARPRSSASGSPPTCSSVARTCGPPSVDWPPRSRASAPPRASGTRA